MTHLGDITKIHGGKIEPVDCITFGSPCQDLSVAGKGAGLAGERTECLWINPAAQARLDTQLSLEG